MESCARNPQKEERLILPATGGVLQNDVVIPGESLGLSLSLSREGLHTRRNGGGWEGGEGGRSTLRQRARARVLKTRICAQREHPAAALIHEGSRQNPNSHWPRNTNGFGYSKSL